MQAYPNSTADLSSRRNAFCYKWALRFIRKHGLSSSVISDGGSDDDTQLENNDAGEEAPQPIARSIVVGQEQTQPPTTESENPTAPRYVRPAGLKSCASPMQIRNLDFVIEGLIGMKRQREE